MQVQVTKKLNLNQHFSQKSSEIINRINSPRNTNRDTSKRSKRLLGNYLKFSRSFHRITLIVILSL